MRTCAYTSRYRRGSVRFVRNGTEQCVSGRIAPTGDDGSVFVFVSHLPVESPVTYTSDDVSVLYDVSDGSRLVCYRIPAKNQLSVSRY